MSASTLTIRMDDELKRSAADVAEYYGLDLSSVVRAVFKQMVNTGRIPLTFAPEEPNGESLNAAAEADSFKASGQTGPCPVLGVQAPPCEIGASPSHQSGVCPSSRSRHWNFGARERSQYGEIIQPVS